MVLRQKGMGIRLLYKKERDINMTSKAKKTKAIRGRKTAPNKANLKADRKRVQRNLEILKELAEKDNA
jgi:hypothetical protein